MLEENTVDAVVEDVVTPQEPETESVQSEVAPDTVAEEKHVQSPEANAKFKEFRLKAEKEKAEAVQKAKDDLIAEQYGESHGIYTEADYKKALEKQKQQELLDKMKSEEVDPNEIYNKLKENDPDFKKYKQIEAEANEKKQIDQLNLELKELDVDVTIKSLEDVANLKNADDIVKHIENGKTLSEAYFLANMNEIIQKKAEKVQKETLEKTLSLQGSSPGALDQSAGTEHTDSYFSMSQDDFNKLKEDVLSGRKR